MGNELEPMASGGQWLRSSADREPHYVVHEAHIKRLLSEGWQPAADPRKPREAKPAEPSREDKLQEALAKALARIEALEAQSVPSSTPAAADIDQSTSDQASGDKKRKG